MRIRTMVNPMLQTQSDCYSDAEDCVGGTCVCNMWDPREEHAAAVWGNYM